MRHTTPPRTVVPLPSHVGGRRRRQRRQQRCGKLQRRRRRAADRASQLPARPSDAFNAVPRATDARACCSRGCEGGLLGRRVPASEPLLRRRHSPHDRPHANDLRSWQRTRARRRRCLAQVLAPPSFWTRRVYTHILPELGGTVGLPWSCSSVCICRASSGRKRLPVQLDCSLNVLSLSAATRRARCESATQLAQLRLWVEDNGGEKGGQFAPVRAARRCRSVARSPSDVAKQLLEQPSDEPRPASVLLAACRHG